MWIVDEQLIFTASNLLRFGQGSNQQPSSSKVNTKAQSHWCELMGRSDRRALSDILELKLLFELDQCHYCMEAMSQNIPTYSSSHAIMVMNTKD